MESAVGANARLRKYFLSFLLGCFCLPLSEAATTQEGMAYTAYDYTGFLNSWDRALDYTVDCGCFMSGIKSSHHNGHEDRRFKVKKTCFTEGNLNGCGSRYETGYLNNWDREARWEGGTGEIMVGVYSYHSSDHEDRRTKIRYERLPHGYKTVAGATSSGQWTQENDWDSSDSQDRTKCNVGEVIIAYNSHHNSGKEDRKFKVKCGRITCLSDYYRTDGGTCLPECLPRTFEKEGNPKSCGACKANCRECKNADSCELCDHGYALSKDGRECVISCPENEYANEGQTGWVALSGVNDDNAEGLQKCTGECDWDSQCETGLVCFQREQSDGLAAIPGCTGNGIRNWDYCFDPRDALQCTDCMTHCESCTREETCDRCQTNFVLQPVYDSSNANANECASSCSDPNLWLDSCRGECRTPVAPPNVTVGAGGIATFSRRDSIDWTQFEWEIEVGLKGSPKVKIQGDHTDPFRVSWRQITGWSETDWDSQYEAKLSILDKTEGSCNQEQTAWVEYTNQCNCFESEDDGQPSVVATQNLGVVDLQIMRRSYCSQQLRVERSVGSKFSSDLILLHDIGQCVDGNVVPYRDVRMTPSSSIMIAQHVGAEVEYCVIAKNSEMYYESTPGCDVITVNFHTTVEGRVTSQGGSDTSVEGVRIDYTLGEVSGHVFTGYDGEYKIEVQSEDVRSDTALMMITPFYSHGGFNHSFTCADYEGCTLVDNEDVDLTFYGVFVVGHSDTRIFDFVDSSVLVIAGKALLAGTEDYTEDGKPCSLPRVQICPYERGTMRTSDVSMCVETSVRDGSYRIAVPIGSSFDLHASYERNNVTAYDIVQLDGTKEHYRYNNIVEHQNNQNFMVNDMYATTIRVDGGLCGLSLAQTTSVLVTMPRFCSLYRRAEEIIESGTEMTIFMPISDFSVEVVEFTNDVYGDKRGNQITEYFDSTRQRIQDLRIYSHDAEDEKGNPVELDLSPHFNYRHRLELDVSVGPTSNTKCSDRFVAESGERTEVKVLASEWYGTSGRCKDVGPRVVRFQDAVTRIPPSSNYTCSGYNGCLKTLGLIDINGQNVSGFEEHTVPGLNNGYERWMVVEYDDEARPEEPNQQIVEVLVTGIRKKGDAYAVTLTDGVPIAVLYDPPGSQSFSQIEAGTTLTSSFEIDTEDEFGGGFDFELGTGGGAETYTCAGLGVVKCLQTSYADFSGSVITQNSGSDTSTNTKKFTSTHTVQTTIKTSDYIGAPGRASDVVLTEAYSLVFLAVDIIGANFTDDSDPSSCRPSVRPSVRWQPRVSGLAVKTIWDIENVEIPTIRATLAQTKDKLRRDKYPSPANNDPSQGAGALEKMEDVNAERWLTNSLEKWNEILREHGRRHDDNEMLLTPSDFRNQIKCAKQEFGDENFPTEEGHGDENFRLCNDVAENKFTVGSDDETRIFFSGGGTEYSLSAAWQTGEEYSYSQTSNFENLDGLKLHAEGKIFGFGATEDTFGYFTFRHTAKTTAVTSEEESTIVSFTLGDIHIGDSFNVEISYDQQFGTPFFRTLSGRSSCPVEPGTVPREDPRLEIIGSPFDNIPPDERLEIVARIRNVAGGVSDEVDEIESRHFTLTTVTGSNQKGLALSVNGAPLHLYEVPDVQIGLEAGTEFTILLTRPPGSYTFEGIQLQLISSCELDIHLGDGGVFSESDGYPLSATAVFDVEFLQYCSAVEFSGVLAGQETFNVVLDDVNDDGTYTLEVAGWSPENYVLPWTDHPYLMDVTVQYRRVGNVDWLTAYDIDGNEINLANETVHHPSGYSVVNIDVTLLDDGDYELRLLSYCSARDGLVGQRESQILEGTIDRTPPRLFGQFAEPVDGTYSPGDSISLTFTEDISCREPFVFDVNMFVHAIGASFSATNPDDVIEIDRDNLDILCSYNTISIAFTSQTTMYTWDTIVGKAVTVYVENVRDIAGNPKSTTSSWTFNVEDFDRRLTVSEVRLSFSDIHFGDFDTSNFRDELSAEINQAITATARRFLEEEKTEKSTVNYELDITSTSGGSILASLYFRSNGLRAGNMLVEEVHSNSFSSQYLSQASVVSANLHVDREAVEREHGEQMLAETEKECQLEQERVEVIAGVMGGMAFITGIGAIVTFRRKAQLHRTQNLERAPLSNTENGAAVI